jgi:hypothetical protein
VLIHACIQQNRLESRKAYHQKGISGLCDHIRLRG